MKKAPEAFRTISEVSDILDTPAHVLRFWESKFYQIRPVKRAGGRRYYRPDDLALLAGIRLLLQDQGMTIRGVQKVLQEQGVRHVASLAPDPSVEESFDGSFEEEGYSDTGAPVGVEMPPERPSQRSVNDAPPPRMPDARPVAPLPLSDGAGMAPETVPETAPETGSDIPAAPSETAPQPVYDGFVSDTGPAATEADFAPGVESGPAAAPPLTRSEPPSADLPVSGPVSEPEPGPVPEPAHEPEPTPVAAPRPPVTPAPDLSDHALNLGANAGTERLARVLRGLPRDALVAEHEKAAMLARRIDALLDRMSDASGAGRW